MLNDTVSAKEEDDVVLKQLKKTQAQASIWDLLMSSKNHRDALVRALDDAKIATDVLHQNSHDSMISSNVSQKEFTLNMQPKKIM